MNEIKLYYTYIIYLYINTNSRLYKRVFILISIKNLLTLLSLSESNTNAKRHMPKTGLEPITVSYKETVLPIKLFRPLDL